MKITSKQYVLRWIMIAISFLIISLILWNTYRFFQKFKEEERIKMENFSQAQIELGKIIDLNGNISDFPLKIIQSNTTTPMINQKVEGQTEIGKGPVISYAPAIQNLLRERIIDTAEDKKIPFQRHASSRVTGTDTDAFAYSNGGVASALISLPLRYMHTTVESVAKVDVENVIRLIYESLKKIKNNHDFRYLK